MSTVHRATLDVERAFVLTPAAIVALEEATGAGIGGLCRRLTAGEFRHAEIGHVVRLALIGAGTPAEDAAQLVAAHVTARPIVVGYTLAVDILTAAYFGAPEQDKTNDDVAGLAARPADQPPLDLDDTQLAGWQRHAVEQLRSDATPADALPEASADAS